MKKLMGRLLVLAPVSFSRACLLQADMCHKPCIPFSQVATPVMLRRTLLFLLERTHRFFHTSAMAASPSASGSEAKLTAHMQSKSGNECQRHVASSSQVHREGQWRAGQRGMSAARARIFVSE